MNGEEYREWLEKAEVEDSKEARGWFECPEAEGTQYIQDHQEWWNEF